MNVMTIDELMLLTREELIALIERISLKLGKFAEGSQERAAALQTIDNIRAVLTRRDRRHRFRCCPRP